MAIKKVLGDYKNGKISLHEAEKRIKLFEMEKVGELGLIDVNRENRTSVPEVIYGESKSLEELEHIVKKTLHRKKRCIITRLDREKQEKLIEGFGKGNKIENHSGSGIMVIKDKDYIIEKTGGRIAVLSAGTSDVARSEEARVMVEEMGCEALTFYDVGVAGIHRLLPALHGIIENDVDSIVVAAGMEGALPSVVAGLVDVPIIGLPISTGYGEGGKGRTALYSMLQSCSPGLAVVNIDNGFGAGVMAAMIANRAARFRDDD